MVAADLRSLINSSVFPFLCFPDLFFFLSPREMNKHLKDERDIRCGVVSLPPDLIGAAAASVSLIDGTPQ